MHNTFAHENEKRAQIMLNEHVWMRDTTSGHAKETAIKR